MSSYRVILTYIVDIDADSPGEAEYLAEGKVKYEEWDPSGAEVEELSVKGELNGIY